jgi:hypothetical protein
MPTVHLRTHPAATSKSARNNCTGADSRVRAHGQRQHEGLHEALEPLLGNRAAQAGAGFYVGGKLPMMATGVGVEEVGSIRARG